MSYHPATPNPKKRSRDDHAQYGQYHTDSRPYPPHPHPHTSAGHPRGHHPTPTYSPRPAAPGPPHLVLPRVYEYVDGKVYVNNRECTDFHKVSTSKIRASLNAQRLENEKLLAKLHTDQKDYVKISKHYERKHAKLKEATTKLQRANSRTEMSAASQQSAMVTQKLMNEQNIEIQLNHNETARLQVTKGALWKAVTTNMRLVNEIHDRNKKIDCLKQVIAQNKQTLKEPVCDDYKEKEAKITDAASKANTKSQPRCADDDGKMAEDIITPSAVSQPDPSALLDPRQVYAAQLVAKTKRYEEILDLLRKKVDVLRTNRKNMI